MSREKEFVDLLMVEARCKLFVVEAPTQEAAMGDLVRFDEGKNRMLGTVIEKMWCVKGEDVYNCMQMIKPIHQAAKIYKVMWEGENS